MGRANRALSYCPAPLPLEGGGLPPVRSGPVAARRGSVHALLLGMLIMLAALGLAGCSARPAANRAAAEAQAAYHGFVYEKPLPKPDFTLTDTSGAVFDFRRETEGYVTLLFFGYTSCPDVCPVHLANIGSALRNLPSDIAARIKVVFVTVDPDRDTPERLRTWLAAFHPGLIGLTGNEEQLLAAQQAAGVPVAVREPTGNSGYTVGHAAYVLVYTPDNLAHLRYPFGIRQAEWVEDLPKLVTKGWER